MFLMWLGEQITSRGVGNGISLIIFAGIVAGLPRSIGADARTGPHRARSRPALAARLILVMAVAVVAFIVFMERAQRRLLIQYPKRQVGNRMFGGETSFLPLKLNTSGVIPPIFASSLLLLPTTVASFSQPDLPAGTGWLPAVATSSRTASRSSWSLYAALIIFFCFFYTSIVFNPDDTAENLQEVWRLPAGHPSGQAHGGVSRLRADPPDGDRRGLHHRRLPAARGPDRLCCNRALLPRRHLDPDRGER